MMGTRGDSNRQAWSATVIAAAVLGLTLLTLGPIALVRLSRGPAESDTPARRPPADDAAAARAAEPGLDDLQPIDSASALLRAATGGELTAPGGHGTLRVPPGALARDTQVEVVRYAVDHPADPGGIALDLRPDGLSLSKPATLELAVPLGLAADEVEIVVFDPRSGRWKPELDQGAGADGSTVAAELRHFSLRRIRIRPGIDFSHDPRQARGTFYMEADAGNTFERYVEGRWRAVRHGTRGYRELMRANRSGRHALIASGRLRAVTGARPRPEIFRDHRRTVAMPAGVPEARTGWVRLTRLDRRGEPTGARVVARVNDYGPGPAARRAGVLVDMSRATMEALGFEWDREFGLAGASENLAWIEIPAEPGRPPLRHVPLRIEAFRPFPHGGPGCRLW